MTKRIISFFIVLFICCNDFGMCKHSAHSRLNFLQSNGKSMNKINEAMKVKIKNKYKHDYISDLIKNQGSINHHYHACLDINCNNRENIHKISWRERSRVKRAANMYPGSSVAIWKRKNPSSERLEIRRSVNKRKFRLSHSPGIKPQAPKANVKIVSKRSVENASSDVNQMTLTPETEPVSQRIINYDSKLEEVLINVETTTTNVKVNDNYILTTTLPIDKPIVEISEKEKKETTPKVSNITLSYDDKNQSLNRNDGLVINHDIGRTQLVSLPKMEVTSEAINIAIDDSTPTTSTSEKVFTLDEAINKPLPALNDSLNKTKDNEEINLNKNVTSDYLNSTLQVSLTDLSVNHDNSKNPSSTQMDRIENSTRQNHRMNSTLDQSEGQGVLKNDSTIVSLTTGLPKPEAENQSSSTQNTETSTSMDSSTLSSTKRKVKQFKPSSEMTQWVKGNLHQLAVISVPYRRCPQGQRLRKGNCVQVY